MTEKLLEFFEEIKEFSFWKNQWLKKLVYDSKGILRGVYERKFRELELKEICKDDKHNVINIKEYRYGEDGLLNKIVVKNNDGTLQYINEVIYDEDGNIKQIQTSTIERKVRFKRILGFKEKQLEIEELKVDNDKIYLDDVENLSKQWTINLDKNLLQLSYSDDKILLCKFSYAIRDAMIFDMGNWDIKLKKGNLFNFSDFDDIEIIYDKKNIANRLNYILDGQVLCSVEYLFE